MAMSILCLSRDSGGLGDHGRVVFLDFRAFVLDLGNNDIFVSV